MLKDFFRQVNIALDEAFKNGKLKREDSRIKIVSSIGPKTRDEIIEVAEDVFDNYKHHILLDNYIPGGVINAGEQPHIYETAETIVNFSDIASKC